MKRPNFYSTVRVQPNQAEVCSTVDFPIRGTGPATLREPEATESFHGITVLVLTE